MSKKLKFLDASSHLHHEKRGSIFDPTSDCCASKAQSKKKASANSGRPSSVQVVMLERVASSIPRGKHRTTLKNCGRIQTIKITRSMSSSQVSDQIHLGFKHLNVDAWHILDCVDNYLSVSVNQILNGNDAIHRKGSVYLAEKDVSECH